MRYEFRAKKDAPCKDFLKIKPLTEKKKAVCAIDYWDGLKSSRDFEQLLSWLKVLGYEFRDYPHEGELLVYANDNELISMLDALRFKYEVK